MWRVRTYGTGVGRSDGTSTVFSRPRRSVVAAKDAGRDSQGEAQVRIGEVPTAQLFPAADAVRDRVAVDAQPRRCLAEAAGLKDRLERPESLQLDCLAPDEDRREELASLTQPIGQVADIGE